MDYLGGLNIGNIHKSINTQSHQSYLCTTQVRLPWRVFILHDAKWCENKLPSHSHQHSNVKFHKFLESFLFFHLNCSFLKSGQAITQRKMHEAALLQRTCSRKIIKFLTLQYVIDVFMIILCKSTKQLFPRYACGQLLLSLQLQGN